MNPGCDKAELKRRVSIIGAVLVVVAALISLRFWQLRDDPTGSGAFMDSPNGRFQLDASNLTFENFWGGRRECYRFSIFDLKAQGRTVYCLDVERKAGEPLVLLRTNAEIEWSDDSSSVTVAFGNTELKIWVGNL